LRQLKREAATLWARRNCEIGDQICVCKGRRGWGKRARSAHPGNQPQHQQQQCSKPHKPGVAVSRHFTTSAIATFFPRNSFPSICHYSSGAKFLLLINSPFPWPQTHLVREGKEGIIVGFFTCFLIFAIIFIKHFQKAKIKKVENQYPQLLYYFSLFFFRNGL
jgi:hypothetical protein